MNITQMPCNPGNYTARRSSVGGDNMAINIIEAFVTKNRCYQIGTPLMLCSIGTPQPGVFGWKEIRE